TWTRGCGKAPPPDAGGRKEDGRIAHENGQGPREQGSGGLKPAPPSNQKRAGAHKSASPFSSGSRFAAGDQFAPASLLASEVTSARKKTSTRMPGMSGGRPSRSIITSRISMSVGLRGPRLPSRGGPT